MKHQTLINNTQQQTSIIKRQLKACGYLAGLLRATPSLLKYKLGRLILDENRAFSLASESVARIPGLLGVYARYAFYKNTLTAVGNDVCFGFMSVISKTETRIGNNVYIGRNCSVGLARIGDHVMLSDNVQLLSGQHQHGSEQQQGKTFQDNQQKYKRIILSKGCWVGTGSVVMNHVGRHAIVGAGSVVVKPVRVRDKVAGTPARSIKASQPLANQAIKLTSTQGQKRIQQQDSLQSAA